MGLFHNNRLIFCHNYTITSDFSCFGKLEKTDTFKGKSSAKKSNLQVGNVLVTCVHVCECVYLCMCVWYMYVCVCVCVCGSCYAYTRLVASMPLCLCVVSHCGWPSQVHSDNGHVVFVSTSNSCALPT